MYNQSKFCLEKLFIILILIMIIFVFRSHEQQSNGYDWRQDTPFWNNGVKSSRTGTSGQSSNKPQVPGNKPNLREEPWTHLHGPASLWPAGQHGYPPGLFFGRKAGVPGGANAGKYINFNQLSIPHLYTQTKKLSKDLKLKEA